MSSMTLIGVAMILVMSFAMPLIIFLLRENIKHVRQGIILDLARFFENDAASSTESAAVKIIPSFEFVKYKYFMAGASSEHRLEDGRAVYYDLPASKYMLAMLPLFAVLLLFSTYVFFPSLFGEFSTFGPRMAGNGTSIVSIIIIISFVSAYIYSLKKLVRAVARFDLDPLTFLTTAIHISSAIVASVVFYLGAAALTTGAPPVSVAGGAGSELGSIALAVFVVAAFVFGLIPDLGTRYISQYAALRLFKRHDDTVLEHTKIVPIEAIDGIDSAIRDRLEDFGIYDVQNLATANPIMMFVETPFGIYQTIDWVAQAQLCAAVGPEQFVKLRSLHVRTIFDLEAAVLGTKRISFDPPAATRADERKADADSKAAAEQNAGDQTPSARLRELVCRIILPGYDVRSTVENASSREIDDEACRKLVQVIADDLHIHRLRQIYLIIQKRLDPRYGLPQS